MSSGHIFLRTHYPTTPDQNFKRRVIRKPNEEPTQLPVASPPAPSRTRCGRQVKRPARFSTVTFDIPDGLSFKGGGSCETAAKKKGSREIRESRELPA